MVTEYGLVVGLIAIFAIFAITTTGTVVRDIFAQANEAVDQPVASTPPASNGGGGGQGVVTPVEDRSFTVTFDAPNPGPAFVGRAFTYAIWNLATVSGPGTILGVNPITLASLTWSVDPSSDPLPDGMSLSASGVLSGVPTAVGTPTLTIRAEAEGTSYTVDIPLSITFPPFEIAEVSYAGDNYCAIATDGELRCWGSGTNGVRGDGLNGVASPYSVRIGTSSDTFTKVDVGGSVACAIHTNTQLWCWGAGNNGLSGRGTNASTFDTPQPITTFSNAAGTDISIPNTGVTYVSVAPNSSPLSAHACLVASGNAYCWGANSNRQLGGLSATPNRPRQVTTSGTNAVKEVEVRDSTSCFLLTVSPWGECVGSRSNGVTAQSSGVAAQNVAPIQGITSEATAIEGRCLWRTDGSFGCWGSNNSNEIGRGVHNSTIYTTVQNNTSHIPDASTGTHVNTRVPGSYVAYEAGETTRCMLTSVSGGNQLYCWGAGSFGGLSRPTRLSVPFEPSGIALSNFSEVNVALIDNDGNLHMVGNVTNTASVASPTLVSVPDLAP